MRPTSFRRRTLIQTSIAGLALGTSRLTRMLADQEAPSAIKRDSARPSALQGVASGDVGHNRAIVWSRCDRPARMLVEWATTESFSDPHRVLGSSVTEATDFTAKIDLRGLPSG